MSIAKAPNGLLSLEQCAEQLQCSPSAVEAFIRAGHLARVSLPSRVVGGRGEGPSKWRVHPRALEQFIEARSGFEAPRGEAAAEGPRRAVLPIATGTDGKSRLGLKGRGGR